MLFLFVIQQLSFAWEPYIICKVRNQVKSVIKKTLRSSTIFMSLKTYYGKQVLFCFGLDGLIISELYLNSVFMKDNRFLERDTQTMPYIYTKLTCKLK